MPYDSTNDADIQAATQLARQMNNSPQGAQIKQNRILANLDPMGMMPVTARPPEDRNEMVQVNTPRGPVSRSQEDIDRNERQYRYLTEQSLPAQILSGAKKAFTSPGRAYEAGATGNPMSQGQMVDEALNVAGMTTLGAGAIPAEANALRMGIKAYHSSPHNFDKFDLSKIGTGEGAQIYGHGLYFAESPAVSGRGGEYWRNFIDKMPSEPEKLAANILHRNEFDIPATIENLKEQIALYKLSSSKEDAPAWRHEILKNAQDALGIVKSGKPFGPRTYEVEIKADPEHFLDWDKPFLEQPEKVQRAMVNKLTSDDPLLTEVFSGKLNPDDLMMLGMFPRSKGEAAYLTLAERMGGDKAASEALREQGIPGIHYWDAGSKPSEEVVEIINKFGNREKAIEGLKKELQGQLSLSDENRNMFLLKELDKPMSKNYVMFDPSLIDIIKKYAKGGFIENHPDIQAAMNLARQGTKQ